MKKKQFEKFINLNGDQNKKILYKFNNRYINFNIPNNIDEKYVF